MYFISGFPRTSRHNEVIWVIVDPLTKSAHFIQLKRRTTMEQLVKTYVQEIVRLHGVPASIISDSDSKFASQFWKSLQRAMGTKLKEEIGMSSYRWQSSPIITAITRVSRWLLLRPYMAGVAALRFVGKKWVKDGY